jgi:type II secretory pathway pseudopilin PulG
MELATPSGEAVTQPVALRRQQGGFTYLAILLAVAFLGIGLAAVGAVWATAAQRNREQQLLFVGEAYRTAIGSYYRQGHRYPQELQELIEDERTGVVRRHLRRLYPDPMTGQPDWELIRDPDGGITGVASISMQPPIKRANFPLYEADFADADCYCSWRFQYVPRHSRAPRAIEPAQP